MSLFLDHLSRGGQFDLCPFSSLNRPCCVMERPKSAPACAATPKSTIQSYRAPAAILARLQKKMRQQWGSFNWRICPDVQPPRHAGSQV
ncbi:hypothetical protein PBY51_015779 [Eleginops maclovinus]|uniref:Uncharacterized protein n=1 Tax=Eleginops maclovinus TaxID=56733 RepID=A0AAN7XPC7_ELEMC|nr:hypothetical protein PBY51_015779 [Eleginops maclovinus]